MIDSQVEKTKLSHPSGQERKNHSTLHSALLCGELLRKVRLIQSNLVIPEGQAQLTWDPAVRKLAATSWSLVLTAGRPAPA